MFVLRPTTQRLIVRSACLALCLAPTLAVGLWAVWLHSSLRRELVARDLSLRLGLRVGLEAIVEPRPGTRSLVGVTLADPESGRELARAARLQWDTRQRPSAIEIRGCRVASDSIDQLVHLAAARLPQASLWNPEPWRLVAGDLVLALAGSEYRLADVQLNHQHRPGGTQTTLAFRSAGDDVGRTVQVQWFRDRRQAATSLVCEVRAPAAALPVALLPEATGAAAWLGRRATLGGYLWARRSESGWELELRGQAREVDFDALVSRHFPHRLSGRGAITLERARVVEGRLEMAAGSLAGGPGAIGDSLVEAAASTLAATIEWRGQQRQEAYGFDQLACDFLLDGQGLWLAGRCRHGEALLDARRAGLALYAPAVPPTVEALLAALGGRSENAPLAPAAAQLAARLPLAAPGANQAGWKPPASARQVWVPRGAQDQRR